MDRQLPVWASIALVAVISALLLVSTHLVTQVFAPPEGAVGKDSAQGEALPAAELFIPVEIDADTGLDSVYKGQASGQTVGYAAQVTVKGYGGPIELVVGMDMNGLLTGISVDGASFSESPGLGAKSKDPEFKNQFVGIQAPVGLKKSDATSGATQSGEWSADATSGATQTQSETPAADATSSATDNGDWAATAAPDAETASATVANMSAAPAADATSSATDNGDWAATAAPDAETASATVANMSAAPAADATSSATDNGDWAATAAPATDVTTAPAAEPTVASAADTASTIDAISGATITSTAVVNGVNQCAAFLKTLLAGVNG